MAKFIGFTPRGKGSAGLLEITPQSINAIEQYIRWAEVDVPSKIPIEMDKLVHYMALLNQNYARKMAYGPYDPKGQNSSLAWRTPAQGIRRISQAYYLGWKVKKRGLAHYILFNATKEAYFIEFGISQVGFGTKRHVPARRIRRPVRKLSLLKTMKFMKTTQAYHRIWVDIYKSRTAHGGFIQHVQSPAGGHLRWENVSEHVAAGMVRRVVRAGLSNDYRSYVRATASGWQVRRANRGGGFQSGPALRGSGQYGGPALGRKLP